MFGIPNNPPITTRRTCATASSRRSARASASCRCPALQTFQYEAKVPAQWHWQAGVQRALPWSMVADVSYVGNHGFNRLGALPERLADQPERGRHRRRLPAAVPGSDRAAARCPARPPSRPTCCGRIAGLGNINQNTDRVLGHLPLASRPRSPAGSATASRSVRTTPTGSRSRATPACSKRLQHAADGTISVRADQAQYEKLNETLDRRPHYLKANAVWDLPNVNSLGAVVGAHPQRLAARRRADGRFGCDLRPELQLQRQRRQREPDRLAGLRRPHRLHRRSGQRLLGQPVRAVQHRRRSRGPTYNSVGLESGRNIMRGCPDKTVDLSISRDIRVGGNRRLEFRWTRSTRSTR